MKQTIRGFKKKPGRKQFGLKLAKLVKTHGLLDSHVIPVVYLFIY